MKIKLIHKETSKPINQYLKENEKRIDEQLLFCLTTEGMPFYSVQGSWYGCGGFTVLSKKDWAIYVATEKVDDKWDYKQVGY